MDHLTTAPPPYQIAAGTWVVPELFPAGPDAMVPVNSLVIVGAEPVVVDTGTTLNRDRWLDAVGGIVDFDDVRWIFVSHDDHDHVGNLAPVLDLAPGATLVTTWFMLERLAGDLRVPLERVRWVGHGESFDAGDRTLVAHRPPVYDSPTTRGLYDASTGVYWAADAFASLVPGHVADVAEVDRAMWEETFVHLNGLISPWLSMLDPAAFRAVVDAVAALDVRVAVSAHTPALSGSTLVTALDLLRKLPDLDPPAEPGQADLEAMLAAVAPAA